jgi:hypothetical protein
MPRLSRRWLRGNLWLPRILSVIAVLSGLLLPFIIVWKSSVYHTDDYHEFSRWAECWLKDSKNIYLDCGSNYPLVGLLASTGALSALKTLTGADDYSQIATYFRIYLAIFEALNFLLLWQLARALKLKHAAWISLVIAALPSSWAGGALWGQIDGVSQFFLLACVLCLVFAIQSDPERHSWGSSLSFTLGLLALVAFVLTKQLAVFSLPAIAPLVLLACLKLWSSGTQLYGAMAAAAAVLLAATAFWILDSSLKVPLHYYGSGYLFVWLVGSSHPYISANGFNIWMLLGRDMLSSSKQPFACIQLLDSKFCLTPFHTGIALYVTYVLALAAFYFALFRRPLLRVSCLFRDEVKMRFILATLILYLAQLNLGFNVFLTGTHERYLYHCFPFLMLAVFFFSEARMLSWRSVFFCLAVASVYGGFVYSVINPLPGFMSPVGHHQFVAAIHLVLLIFLFLFSLSLLQSSILGSRARSPTWKLQRSSRENRPTQKQAL